jgi:hypothetical protein
MIDSWQLLYAKHSSLLIAVLTIPNPTQGHRTADARTCRLLEALISCSCAAFRNANTSLA